MEGGGNHPPPKCYNEIKSPVLIGLRPGENGQHRLKSDVTILSIANDSETNNSVCQAMLASFVKALRPLQLYGDQALKSDFISIEIP